MTAVATLRRPISLGSRRTPRSIAVSSKIRASRTTVSARRSGGEIRIGDEGGANLVLSGHYVVCEYDGSSKYLTSSNHREKDIEIDHVNYRLRCTCEIPMESGRCFTLGVQYQVIDTEAMIESTALTPEEIIASRERFDKEVEFELEAVTGMIGLTF